MTADPHFGFVVAAYAIGFIILSAMIFAITWDYYELRRTLARFKGRGDGTRRVDEAKP